MRTHATPLQASGLSSSVLSEALNNNQVRIVASCYDMKTGIVSLLE